LSLDVLTRARSKTPASRPDTDQAARTGARSMTDPQHDNDLAVLAAGHDTGFWDEHGNPAPWPDDITQWRPVTAEPNTLQPGEQPF
jgi:hypothetical protein